MSTRGATADGSPEMFQTLYEMLLEATPSSVLLIDRDMRIVSANRNFVVKSRMSLESVTGSRLEDVFPAVIWENLHLRDRVRQVFATNRATQGERMVYRAPGLPMRTYYYRILPFFSEGKVENAMLLMEDVTEQVKLSEEARLVERHLACVVESASDIVLSTDTAGGILTWNAAAEKLSGFSFVEVRHRCFTDFCSEEHRGEAEEVFVRMSAGRPRMAELDLLTKHGGSIRVSWVFSPMKDDMGKMAGIVAVGRDLSERRKFEMQLMQSQKLAALGVMAGGIAHEIRNPLAICSSAAQFLGEDGLEPSFRAECIGKITTGIKRASDIIENLLRFARPSQNPSMERVNLVSLLGETVDLVVSQAKVKNIDIRTHAPHSPVWVRGIPSLLQQVFLNLFLNAINAMPGGGSVDVGIERHGPEVVVRVADTGHGIPDEEIGNVFDPFYTGEQADKGTGLGLSICYSVVKQHLGDIDLESEVGKGTTFTVRLPNM